MTDNTDYLLKPCHICGTTMHVHQEHNDYANDTLAFVDGQHDVDCVFKIHFRPTRYLTPEEAAHAWNAKTVR